MKRVLELRSSPSIPHSTSACVRSVQFYACVFNLVLLDSRVDLNYLQGVFHFEIICKVLYATLHSLSILLSVGMGTDAQLFSLAVFIPVLKLLDF